MIATIGEILKAERRRADGQLSAMAKRCHVSRSHLANIEDGRKTPTRHIVTVYAEVYPNVRNRREILAFLATGAVAGPTALALDLDSALAAASPRSVDRWAEILYDRTRAYTLYAEVPQVRQSLLADLAAINNTRTTPRLQAITGRMATLYGQTCRQLGGPLGALSWYERGIRYADLAEDPDAQVWCRARAAQALRHLPAYRRVALEWSNQAVALSKRPTTGLVSAHMTLAADARCEADLLAQLDAADRAMDIVGCDVAATDEDITWWRQAISKSGYLAGFGSPRAQAVTDEALRALPSGRGHLRFEVHAALHQAAIYFDAGDRVSAVQLARHAVGRLPVGQRSESVLSFAAELESGRRERRGIDLKRSR